MHLSAEKGLDAVLAALLERGADVNARDEKGRTPLLFACEGVNSAECCLVLMEHGGDTSTLDDKVTSDSGYIYI